MRRLRGFGSLRGRYGPFPCSPVDGDCCPGFTRARTRIFKVKLLQHVPIRTYYFKHLRAHYK